MSEFITYDYPEKQYVNRDHRRAAFDGNVVGQNRCLGYCSFSEHPGYVTADLMRDHQCREKNCRYFVPKTKNESFDQKAFKTVLVSMEELEKKVFSLACEITESFEGLRIIGSSVDELGKCELTYVTISSAYDLNEVASRIEKQMGCCVSMKEKKCDFDHAIELIFKKRG